MSTKTIKCKILKIKYFIFFSDIRRGVPTTERFKIQQIEKEIFS